MSGNQMSRKSNV